MKKLIFSALLTLILISCSAITIPVSLPGIAPQQEATQTTPAEPTQTHTTVPSPTETPVLPTLTFTLTPTMIGYKTHTPTPDVTSTPIGLFFVPNTSLPPVQMEGFSSVTISLNEIYKARGCSPSVVRITAQVANDSKIEHVMLFARFKSLQAERASKWSIIYMSPISTGTYIFDLSSDKMLEDIYFETSWIEYQVVSTNKAGKEIGRTDIFKERLKMLECKP